MANPILTEAQSKMDGALHALSQQLDGLRIRAIITSTEATPLNKSSQTIRLENITATLVGRVVIEDDKD